MAEQVPMGYMEALTSAINKVTGASKLAAQAELTRLLETRKYEKPLDLVEDALKALEPLFQQVTASTASLSAQAYDIIRLAELGEAFGAQPYPDRDPEWTREAMYGAAEKSKNMSSFLQALLDRMDYEAKRAAGSTQFQNGAQDKKGNPRFARIPTGKDTCPFCIMLASRGYVYLSSKTAGKLDHYHANCDCRVAPSFGRGSIEGYDPDVYLEQYSELLDSGKLNEDSLRKAANRAHKRARA